MSTSYESTPSKYLKIVVRKFNDISFKLPNELKFNDSYLRKIRTKILENQDIVNYDGTVTGRVRPSYDYISFHSKKEGNDYVGVVYL